MKISEDKIIKNFDKIKFQKYLVDNNIKSSALSKEIGHSHSYISDIMCGHNILKKTQYNLITLVLGVPYDTFLLSEEPIKPLNSKTEDTEDIAEIKDALIRLNAKTKKLNDKAEKEEKLLTSIDLSLRNIGNLLVQINEKLR